MKKGLPLLATAMAIAVLGGATYLRSWRHRVPRASASPAATSPTHAPPGVRVRVQVINTTTTRGLARRATRVLRDEGFDVVEMSTAHPARDSTVVLDRSGHPAWAATIAALLGSGARAEARPDTSRYLDVTVLLGTTWRPPAKPLDP